MRTLLTLATKTRWVLLAGVLLFAREAHVSGGYEECYADVEATLCVMSDVRKAFRDDQQARDWIDERRTGAERRLFTAIPIVRTTLATARGTLPLAAIDDWRLPVSSSPSSPEASGGAQRVHLELGSVGRDIVSIRLTTTRALRDDEREHLVTSLKQALKTPAYEPRREREGIYAPSLRLARPEDLDDGDAAIDDGRPKPPKPSTPQPPAPPLAVEDVRAWQPLFVSEDDDVEIPLAIGTSVRVSPRAQERWRPWMQAHLKALRAAWSSSLPKRVRGATKRDHGFRDVAGFRPWGPLLLAEDVQARIDDGALVRMARTRTKTAKEAEALYGPLTEALRAATTKTPLPPPPSPAR